MTIRILHRVVLGGVLMGLLVVPVFAEDATTNVGVTLRPTKSISGYSTRAFSGDRPLQLKLSGTPGVRTQGGQLSQEVLTNMQTRLSNIVSMLTRRQQRMKGWITRIRTQAGKFDATRPEVTRALSLLTEADALLDQAGTKISTMNLSLSGISSRDQLHTVLTQFKADAKTVHDLFKQSREKMVQAIVELRKVVGNTTRNSGRLGGAPTIRPTEGVLQ